MGRPSIALSRVLIGAVALVAIIALWNALSSPKGPSLRVTAANSGVQLGFALQEVMVQSPSAIPLEVISWPAMTQSIRRGMCAVKRQSIPASGGCEILAGVALVILDVAGAPGAARSQHELQSCLHDLALKSIRNLQHFVVRYSEINEWLQSAVVGQLAVDFVVLMGSCTLLADSFEFSRAVIDAVGQMKAVDALVMGHILDEQGAHDIPWLHEQLLILDLAKWAAVGLPPLLPPTAGGAFEFPYYAVSAQQVHDNYTPLWLTRAADDLPSRRMHRLTNHRTGPPLFGTVLLAVAAELGLLALNIPEGLRQGRYYAYPFQKDSANWRSVWATAAQILATGDEIAVGCSAGPAKVVSVRSLSTSSCFERSCAKRRSVSRASDFVLGGGPASEFPAQFGSNDVHALPDIAASVARKLGTTQIASYVSVVGGLAGLDLLAQLQHTPTQMVFFDYAKHQLFLAQLVVQLVILCSSRTEFVSAYTARDLAAFLRSTNSDDLNLSNQDHFMSSAISDSVVKRVLASLDAVNAQSYQQYIVAGLAVFAEQAHFVPVYSYDRYAPNTLSIGYRARGSMLESEQSYAVARGHLRACQRIVFTDWDLNSPELLPAVGIDFGRTVSLFTSNADQVGRDGAQPFVLSWMKLVSMLRSLTIQAGGRFCLISAMAEQSAEAVRCDVVFEG